jgi:transcriptional regulator with XRE-family HTH domain
MDGKELKRRREALNMSVQELAELLGVTRISLHRWERDGIKERSGMLHLALRYLEDQQLRGRLERDAGNAARPAGDGGR